MTDVRVENIDDLKLVRDWYARHHYSGTPGNGQHGRIGYYVDGELLAIVSFGNATNVHGLAKRLELSEWKGNIELSRLAVHPDAPDNTASQAVAAALAHLYGRRQIEWVFSYADTGQGHHGGIYQALNAAYIGRSENIALYLLNGERFHNRNAAERWGSNAFPHEYGTLCPGKSCKARRCVGRLAAEDGFDLQKDWQGSSEKHTYILIATQNKRDRKLLRDHLKQFSMPYPKRDGVGDVSGPVRELKRAGVSRENGSATSGASQGQSLDPALGGGTGFGSEVGPAVAVPGLRALRLYPYQRVGAAFMATARAALNGDDMRVGKTPQAIRALQLLDAVGESVFPALVVAPASVKNVWARHLAEWWPGVRTEVPRAGTAAAVRSIGAVKAGNADVLVVNYETLANVSRLAPYGSIRLEGCIECDPLSSRAHSRCQRERKAANDVAWRTVVADEVHRASDPKAQMTRALWALGDPAEFRFGLTGSPPEEPDRFWAVMRFVAPDEYARKTAFIDRYADTAPNIWSGFAESIGYRAETRPELDKFLLPRFIRRPLEAVSGELPPARMVREVELVGKQAKAYDEMRRALVARLDDGTIFAANPLMELLRLRQFACAYGEADGVGGMRLSEPSSKLDVLEEVLDELGQRQAVVFAESRQLIDLAAERLGDSIVTGIIHGGISEQDRVTALDGFESGRFRVLLCTIGAGGEGLDMSAADTAIFLQRSFSSRMNKQAEARIRGPNQQADGTTVVDLVTVNTVEGHVRDVLADKAARLESLVRDADTLRRWLS